MGWGALGWIVLRWNGLVLGGVRCGSSFFVKLMAMGGSWCFLVMMAMIGRR